MKVHVRYRIAISLLLILGICGFLIPLSFRGANAQKGGVVPPPGAGQAGTLSPAAQAQIAALLAEKQALTPAQRKLHSSLRHGIKMQRGELMTAKGEVTTSRSAAAVIRNMDKSGRMQVEIKAKVDKPLITMIEKYGGQITRASEKEGMVRAWVPWDAMESLADSAEDKTIRPAL